MEGGQREGGGGSEIGRENFGADEDETRGGSLESLSPGGGEV